MDGGRERLFGLTPRPRLPPAQACGLGWNVELALHPRNLSQWPEVMHCIYRAVLGLTETVSTSSSVVLWECGEW